MTTVPTKVAVYQYTGVACPASPGNVSQIWCSSPCPGAQGYVSFTAIAGFAYAIEIGGQTPSSFGTGFFTITINTNPTSGFAFCTGDGSGFTACPCGNYSTFPNNEGCLNSLGSGGKLVATGTASISADSVVLEGSLMPNGGALYYQGSSQLNAGNGAQFGDGLRCPGGTLIRLGVKINVGGASQYPEAGDLSVSAMGLVTMAGNIDYQIWYRDSALYCTASTFNLSNGFEIAWGP